MINNRVLRIAILEEDKLCNYGIKMLFNKSLSDHMLIDTFYTLEELITASSSTHWDLIITSIDSKEFSVLDFLIWLDTPHNKSLALPNIIFSHCSELNPFPMEIINFYSHHIFCKNNSVHSLIQMIVDILNVKYIARRNRTRITDAEYEVLLELSTPRSVDFLSRNRGIKRKTIFSHKNSAMKKLGVKSANHFFAIHNRNQVANLMRLSCFR
ncbi:helix-turn-helix transcriptional regulator [Serratia sp. (in: enterobacteria)]|uniref:helix-turn-helix transcriptional regulator n=1 Tax=Serratia sp. (in: enterobacteria) TaxID=616 RepID=UPI0039899A47